MLITVLGVPSSLSQHAIHAIQLIARTALGSVDLLHFTTIEQLQEQWTLRQSDHVILHTDNPDARIASLLAANAKQIILVSEDPVLAALYLRDSAIVQLEFAIRAVSSIFASLHDVILQCPKLLTLSPGNCTTPASLVAHVLSFLDLQLTDEQAGEVLHALGYRNGNWWSSEINRDEDAGYVLNKDDQALLQSLIPYRAILRMKPAERFSWPRELFFGTDRVGAPISAPFEEVIELVGPARVLCYGPYFHLPPGDWILNSSFEVNDNYSGNELLIEILAGHETLVHRPALLPAQGNYFFEVPFTVTEPRNRIEFRLWTRQGAIEGTLALKKIEVSRNVDWKTQPWSGPVSSKVGSL